MIADAMAKWGVALLFVVATGAKLVALVGMALGWW